MKRLGVCPVLDPRPSRSFPYQTKKNGKKLSTITFISVSRYRETADTQQKIRKSQYHNKSWQAILITRIKKGVPAVVGKTRTISSAAGNKFPLIPHHRCTKKITIDFLLKFVLQKIFHLYGVNLGGSPCKKIENASVTKTTRRMLLKYEKEPCESRRVYRRMSSWNLGYTSLPPSFRQIVRWCAFFSCSSYIHAYLFYPNKMYSLKRKKNNKKQKRYKRSTYGHR